MNEIKTDEAIAEELVAIKKSMVTLIQSEAPVLTGEDISKITDIKVDTLQFRENPELTPIDELEEVVVNPNFPDQKVKIGKQLLAEERSSLVSLLRANLDVFAWRVEDMKGVRDEVSVHELNVDPSAKPIRQKRRIFSMDKQKAIREEVDRLLRAGIIREVYYPSWLANVVMVKKSNGKWRMCVDFTDLNKACPKDCYPLPRIDKLIDSISGHRLLSFLDAYYGYHQVRMTEKDVESTSFQTSEGTYCHEKMPFGLKNAGATFSKDGEHDF